jgi:hypothetical protein
VAVVDGRTQAVGNGKEPRDVSLPLGVSGEVGPVPTIGAGAILPLFFILKGIVMTRITIGIDPDTKATGIGVLKNGKPEFAVTAEASGRLAFDRVEEMGCSLHKVLLACKERIGSHLLLRAEIEIAIEWFSLRKQDIQQGVGKCNRIMALQGVAGLAFQAAKIVFPMVRIVHVYPCNWKGTVPKKIHQNRLRTHLKSDLLDNMERDLGKTKFSHVLDGLGLALALYKQKI